MRQEGNIGDWAEMQKNMAEGMKWANLGATIGEISQENSSLVKDLSRFDRNLVVPYISSLLTIPEYQSNCIRIEILVALAVKYCDGKKRPKQDDVMRWFHQVGESACVLAEDPAEDVFVSLIVDPAGGDYRIIEGVWEAASFYTEKVVEVIDTMPDREPFSQVQRSVRAILKVSDLVCDRSGLERYELGSDECHSKLSRRTLPSRKALMSRTFLDLRDIEALDIELSDLEPFMLSSAGTQALEQQSIGLSDLDRRPLMVSDDGNIMVALPTSISIAARNFCIEFVQSTGLSETFDEYLAAQFASTIRHAPLLGGPMRAPVVWRKLSDGSRCAAFHFEFDKGYVISFHIYLPPISTHNPGGFKDIYIDDGPITGAIQNTIDAIVEECDGKDEFNGGLVVIAGCGWGKGYATKHVELSHPKWRVQTMSIADLIRASWLSEMTPLKYWRMQDGLDAIEKSGVHIMNVNGILNLIGWVQVNDGHFVPHSQIPEGRISPDRPLVLNPPLNLLRNVRAASDMGYDHHSVRDQSGRWHSVKHVSPDPYFSSDSSRRVYGSVTDIRDAIMTAVYEGERNYWISVCAPLLNDSDAEYRLWEMCREWLHRIASVIDDNISGKARSRNLCVKVSFLDSDPLDMMIDKPDHFVLESLCSIEIGAEPSTMNVVFSSGFLAGFRHAENIAERVIVRTITKAFLCALGEKETDALVQDLESLIVLNEEARSFHLFNARSFLDFTRDKLTKDLIGIDSLDDAAAKVGLGWRVAAAPSNGKITGRKACNKFLADVVDVLIAEIVEVLENLERVKTITRIVENIEKAHAEEDHWRRTSAAALGLHGADQSTMNRFVERLSDFAGAGATSRILVEMAVCHCPIGEGRDLSDIMLGKLIARASLIFQIGGLSDAIRFNALSPNLKISPLGDILFQDDFGREVVQPMLSTHTTKTVMFGAGEQKVNYEEPSITPTAKGEISEEFWTLWMNEMGFDIDEARTILDAFDDIGIQLKEPIYKIKRSEAILKLTKSGLSVDVADRFIDRYSLWPRPKWEKVPDGYKPRDIYPWRFGRRLSYATRPIVQLDLSDDPLLLIAPSALRKGFTYVFSGTFEGRLDQDFFQTKGMKNDWWGKASEGHTFNAKVASTLIKNGWNVRENIEITEVLNDKLDKDYGDIDVLAWDRDSGVIMVIESKDLSMARSYSEIAALLSDYQGVDREGKPDKLKRHLDRVSIIKANIDKVGRFAGMSNPKVVSWLICSGIVPMQFAKIEALADTNVGSIEDLA